MGVLLICTKFAEMAIYIVVKMLMQSPQTTNHIVESSSLTKLVDDGLLQLHCADDNVVTWLRDVAMKPFTKQLINQEHLTAN